MGLGIYRPAFLEALVHLVDHSRTHFNKRCISISIPEADRGAEKVKIHFADGTEAEADVVLGADGIKSAVRSFVVEDHDERITNGEVASNIVRVKYTNTIAYRGLVSVQKIREKGIKVEVSKQPYCWIGPGKVELTDFVFSHCLTLFSSILSHSL